MKRTGIVAILIICTFIASAQKENTDTSFQTYLQNIPGTSTSFKMVPIPGGSFTMGSAKINNEGPAKRVNVSGFWMGAYEVTHDEFDLFFRDVNTPVNSEVDAVTRPTPQYIDLSWGMGKAGGYPINSMSQDAALMYCRWLYKKTGIFFRLPTEAEWEYACRAGSTTAYPFGDDLKGLDKYAWFEGNSSKKYHKVGQKLPNAWGLYDMIGNVSEWTLDQYDENYFQTIGDTPVDPVIPPSTRYPRSIRGGSFMDGASDLHSSSRSHSDASWNKRDPQIPKSRWWLTDAMFVGFRIVRPLRQPTAQEAEAFFNKYLKN